MRKGYLILSLLVALSLIGCAKQNEPEVKVIEDTRELESLLESSDETASISGDTNEEISDISNDVPEENVSEQYGFSEKDTWKYTFLSNLGKTIEEVDVIADEDVTNLRGVLTDADTSWLFAQSEDKYGVLSDWDDSHAYFVNPTNEWISEDEAVLGYYILSEKSLFRRLLETDIPEEFNLENARSIMGEPIAVFGEDQDRLVYEIDSAYIILDWYLANEDYYLVRKEDCSLVLGEEWAKELGHDSIIEESTRDWDGDINFKEDLILELGKRDKIRMCNRLFSFKNLDKYNIKTDCYTIDKDGNYNVIAFTIEPKDNVDNSLSLRGKLEFCDHVTPFYSEVLANEGDHYEIEILHEDKNCIVYKLNEGTIGFTDAVCVHSKKSNINMALTYGEYDTPNSECIERCKEIVEYFDSNVKVEIMKGE